MMSVQWYQREILKWIQKIFDATTLLMQGYAALVIHKKNQSRLLIFMHQWKGMML